MTTTLPVVAGIDYSAASTAAAEFAAWEAHQRRVPLRLVHAMERPPTYGGGAGAGWLVTTIVEDSTRLLAEVCDRLRRRYPELAIEHAVLTAGPAAALVAESARACLVVLGERGSGGFPELLAGSVTTQVAAHAHAPVVVVRPNACTGTGAPATGAVVVGVDGSDECAAAIGFAFDEAQARGVGLVAVYAWDVLPDHNLGPARSWNCEPQLAQQEAERLLAEAVAGWAEKYPDVPVTQRAIQTLSPAAVLRDTATGAGLLVVGSRGRGGFTGLLLGSISRVLVSHARCSVAVVHAH